MSLSGGKKRMWLRVHRDEVLAYLEKNGEEATMKEYHLRKGTLDRVISLSEGYYPRFTRYDSLELKINRDEVSIADLRGELRELKELFAVFQESVAEQIKQNFLIPLLQAGIRPPEGLELAPHPDLLNVNSLIEQARSCRS